MPHILIVDDNDTNLYLLESLLTGHGLAVTSARNGEAALSKARLAPPDLVITDILMPVMDGYTLCRRWRADPVLQGIPLIFYTATYTKPEDEAFAMSLGADRFLLKPQEPDVIMNVVQDLLQPKPGAKQALPLGEEMEFFRQYNDILFRKLEKKMVDLERANRELTTLEDMLRTVFKAVPHAVTVLDADGIIRNVNDAAFDLFGYPREEVVGRDARFLFFSNEEYSRTEEALYGNPGAARTSVIESRLRRKDGAEIWALLSATALQAENGSSGAVVAALDVTARKNLEERLRQSQKMEAIGQLAGGVAHDFNNMLQAILGYTDMVLFSLGPDDPNRAKLMEVYKAGRRAATLTHQLLAFSRRQVLQLAPLDLNQVIEELMKMVRRLIGENIELAILPGRELWTVSADRGQIEQVLMNLCVNARDAMPEGGRLSIETDNIFCDEEDCARHEWAKPGRYVEVSVTDTGCGMDKATLDKIFEPFFTTKEPDKGTGLGLATVYGIVRQHEGMIQVHSEPGQGSRFCVYLSAITQAEAEVIPEAAEPVRGGQETILLAEDNEAIRLLARNILTASGYRVLAAADGEEALRLYGQHGRKIDLLVLDVVMPKKSGHSVYDEIRALRPDVRCLFVSGYSVNALQTNFIAEGKLRLIQKPYKNLDLLRTVREVLDQPLF